jgi:uncharacterized UPF0146 family protein
VDPISPRCGALCARLGAYDPLVEIGIGRRPEVAAALAARGSTVIATDAEPRDIPETVTFRRDDAFDPDLGVYADGAAIYALNCPPELHEPIRAIARAVEVPFLFTTLGADAPSIPATIETIPGDTLFRAIETEQRQPTVGDGERDRGGSV